MLRRKLALISYVSGQIFWQLSIPLKSQYKYKPDAQAREEVPLKFPRLRVGLVFEWFSKHQKYLPHTSQIPNQKSEIHQGPRTG